MTEKSDFKSIEESADNISSILDIDPKLQEKEFTIEDVETDEDTPDNDDEPLTNAVVEPDNKAVAVSDSKDFSIEEIKHDTTNTIRTLNSVGRVCKKALNSAQEVADAEQDARAFGAVSSLVNAIANIEKAKTDIRIKVNKLANPVVKTNQLKAQNVYNTNIQQNIGESNANKPSTNFNDMLEDVIEFREKENSKETPEVDEDKGE